MNVQTVEPQDKQRKRARRMAALLFLLALGFYVGIFILTAAKGPGA